ncbi:MAG: 16S rRNA (adenine(1518)-N(6)/adenine(1519)-N(6))-dimethyltransferase RsmA [Patescibacteria group bacterium]
MHPRAKKHFGQNWLVDETVVAKIIDAAEIKRGETVLEVGPGTGVLTQALVNAGAHVIAVEADKSLIAPLREKFGDTIELIQGDVLSLDFDRTQAPAVAKALAGEKAWGYHHKTPYKLVANIPYNITSDLLRHFLTTELKPSRMVLMLQKEVADRILAAPPDMSLLSVVCQLYAQCRRVVNVPAGAFRPIPKVDSAVVRLDLYDVPAIGEMDPEEVIALAKLGFSSPRKQLHGNLKGVHRKGSSAVKEALVACGLPATARAEALTVENWIALTHILG